MPTTRRPPAVSIEPLVPGSGSRRRRHAPPSGLSTPAPPPAQRPRPGTPAPTGVSVAASGPPRSRPPVVHQGIMTVYLPVPEILCFPYPCYAGCQARTSVSLRLSAWRSHMEQNTGFGQRGVSTTYDGFFQFFWYRDPTTSRPSSFRCSLSSTIRTTDPSNRFPVSKTSWRQVFHIDAIHEYRIGLQQFGYRFSVGVKLRGVYHAGPLFSHFWLRFFHASAVAFGYRNATVRATRSWSPVHDWRGFVRARLVFKSSHRSRLHVVCFEGFLTDVHEACRRPRHQRLRRRIGHRAGGRTECLSCRHRRQPPHFVDQFPLLLIPFPF
ncbi:hypothetical protein MRX96_045002 [Rhipicephalus microplus]